MPPGPTQRLAFREMTASDLDAMADLLGDPEVMAFYPRPKSRAEALGWIEWNQRLYRERGFGLWAIELRDTGAFVGDCGLTPQEVDGMPEVEVGYHVRRLLQGRGYATEAAAAVRDAVLGPDSVTGDDVTLVHAHIAPGHMASVTVARRLGLVPTEVVHDGETRWHLRPSG